MKIHSRSGALLCAFFFVQSIHAFAQGSLTPPGVPAPTMKSLDQVEPRTPINDTAVPGDANYHHIITTAGSYYLTGNLAVTKPNGIDVRAEGVTLDLNGFEIRRTAGAGGNGIEVDATAHRGTIKNGSLKGFAYGLQCVFSTNYARGGRCLHLSVSGCSVAGLLAGEGWQLDGCTAHDNTGTGIDAATGSTLSNCTATANSAGTAGIDASSNCTLSNCTATNNTTTYGIVVGNGSTLTNCSAVGNTGSAGIGASSGSTLTNCSAYSNTVSFGIDAVNGCTLKNCAARFNTSAATVSGGIDAGTGSALIGCAATSNTNSNATASASTGLGIHISTGSTVRDCTIEGNKGDGIQVVGDGCHVVGNTCTYNCTGITSGDPGGGIHLTSSTNACRIDGNHCVGGTRSFHIEGSDNLLVRNSAQGATVGPYSYVAGNQVASEFTPSGTFTSTQPWANFSF